MKSKDIKIVLRENVPKLGKRGDIVTVKDGYARNYLIPKNIGLPASSANLLRIEGEKRKYIQSMAKFKEEREDLANKLGSVKIEIPTKMTAQGHLYGAISDKHILKALEREGIILEPNSIYLEEPIKEMGIYKIKVSVHPELPEVDIELWITNEELSKEERQFDDISDED